MYEIELLPAAHGDAIWIEYGPAERPARVVIDGGPAPTYARGLRARLDKIRGLAGNPPSRKVIDLLVVSHIDCDHIDGAVIFLQECKQLGISVNEIWFNGWRKISESKGEVLQPLQGEFLGALVRTDADFKKRWNKQFNGNAVVVQESGPLKSYPLPHGAQLFLLSPYRKELDRLRRKWAAAIRGFSPGDEEAALERLRLRREYRPPPLSDIFTAGDFGSDRSAPNGSSIAFILNYESKSCLFAADAHARVLVRSLRRLAKDRQVDRLKFDAVKLPHHGSIGNVTEELLSLVQCDTWLVSTNGAVFDHPDREAIELIGRCAKSRIRILCNYRVPSTERLRPKKGENWAVEFPEEGKGLKLVLESDRPQKAAGEDTQMGTRPRGAARSRRGHTPAD